MIGIAAALITSALLFILPRRYAVIPLLVGLMWMTRAQLVEIGPAGFSVVRILVLVGALRVLLRREGLAGGLIPLDRVIALWGLWLMVATFAHPADQWVYRGGLVWDSVGTYLLFRVFVRDDQDILRAFTALCWLAVPVALLMWVEKLTGTNPFAVLGAVSEHADYRDGQFRARGPFAHAILAGTVGASLVPLAWYLRGSRPWAARAGLVAGTAMVIASTSSGPVLFLAAILFGLGLWRLRHMLWGIRWLAVLAVIGLEVVMLDPFYYIIARLDVTGASQSWFRARLIESSIEHLDEWWLAGTDYTRHWMASGVPANPNHTDITNHFLAMGVKGGLPLMLLLGLAVFLAFRMVGRALRARGHPDAGDPFLAWTLGALLFGHLVNFFGISLFDQSVAIFYLVLACIAALCAGRPAAGRAPSGQGLGYADRAARQSG
jgi:hypothetical protein